MLWLDVAHEAQRLTEAEFNLRKLLKLRLLGLAAIERTRKRQASRRSWLRAGDEGTKFFHAKMRSRRRKNHIHNLKVGDAIVMAHEEKEAAIYHHFSDNIGTKMTRSMDMNWQLLEMPTI